ncbi:MAG: Nuclease [Bacteroidetes bacterium]|jgi:hypothetical protein|nr:Nuclease [Bacteroidota bacterium]
MTIGKGERLRWFDLFNIFEQGVLNRRVKLAIFEQNFLVMKKNITICLLGILCFMPQLAWGWGLIGHRVIGELAQKKLNKTAQRRIDAVLKHAGVAMVANWGDFVRSDEKYEGREVWHYKDIASGLNRDAFNKEAVTKNDGEAVFRVQELITKLKKEPNNEENLKMLIHLLGDMHQPLHMGHPEDKGGNTIRFKWQGREVSLHSLWDEGLIDFQKLSYTEYANYLFRTHTAKTVTFQPSLVLDWAWETYQAAQKVYDSVSKTENQYKYNYEYVSLLEERLSLAGDHLACVLNYIYGGK